MPIGRASARKAKGPRYKSRLRLHISRKTVTLWASSGMITLEAPFGVAFAWVVIRTKTVCSGHLSVIWECPAIKGKECSGSQTRRPK